MQSKIAFLITAYHQPNHLVRLIKSLDRDGSNFYIHIDAKKDLAPFVAAVNLGFLEKQHINFLQGSLRVKFYWGGFGLVEATLNLMKEAAQSEFNFSRYCLLSGSDFPIKSPEEIYLKLNSSNIEYLSVDRQLRLSKNNISHWDRRAYYYHFRDNSFLVKLGLSGGIPRLRPCPIPIYLGSGWWCLTRDAIFFVLNFIENNPQYLNWARHVDIPDEVFIHSIIKASPFSEKISDDFEKPALMSYQPSEFVAGIHYINWSEGRPHPKILDENDYASLRQLKALFARKFEEPHSNKLVDHLISSVMSDRVEIH
jgi:hypothetical protein